VHSKGLVASKFCCGQEGTVPHRRALQRVIAFVELGLEMASKEATECQEQHNFTSTQETAHMGDDGIMAPVVVSGKIGDPYVMLKNVQHLLPCIKKCTRLLETTEQFDSCRIHVQQGTEETEVVQKEIHELQELATEAKIAMESFRNVFNDLENKVHQVVCFADESARGTANGAVNVSSLCY